VLTTSTVITQDARSARGLSSASLADMRRLMPAHSISLEAARSRA